MNKIISTIVAVAAGLALTACTVEEPTSESGKGSSSAKENNFTAGQKQAISAAKNYLDLGTGFSRQGLIQQLTAKTGSGFPRKDAVFAVRQIRPNWNRQAVLAAKNYLDLGTGFSRDGLIQQLTAKTGSGFTQAQAEFAVKKVGL